jgi:hypothetical protein
MASNTYKEGRKVKGFFGIFDVLGYSKMIESNDLDSLIEIYKRTLGVLDDKVLCLGDFDKSLLATLKGPKSFAFSDTIVLYQDLSNMPNGPIENGTSIFFLGKVCHLLRQAFELGIPLRGAVSYGEYYIQEDKGCFIGYPIIEAHNEESKQNWSGATLCKSAWDKLWAAHNESMEMQGEWRGSYLKGFFSPLNYPFLEKYPIPYKSSHIEGVALCWHDVVLDFMCLDNPSRFNSYNSENIGQFVREKFEAHGKIVDNNDDKTKMKIENTANFLGTMQTRYRLGLTSMP